MSSLNLSPVGFSWSLQYLGCRLVATSSDESETNLRLANFSSDSGNEKIPETLTTSATEHQRPANSHHHGNVADAFLDMGFNHDEIKELLSVHPRLPSRTGLAVVSELLLLGLSTDSILKTLQKNTELLRMSPKHLKDRTDLLRKFNFKEGIENHSSVDLCL